MDDLAVFVTSNGEVMVWRGTDPTSANTWALVGLWEIGSPVGRRCMTKFAGDLLIVGQDGLLPMSAALQSSRVNPKVALTNKIQGAVSTATSTYASNFGWEICYYPKSNALLLNVPISEGTSQQQYVMNTITKAWCNFTGWAANCFVVWADQLYFGGNGFVAKAWSGTVDDTANITTAALQAFNYFGAPGQLKRFTMIRPVLLSNGTPALQAGLNIDFDTSIAPASLAFSPTSYGAWDGVAWDTGIWGGGLAVNKNWQGANGVGYSAAPVFQSSTQGIEAHWVSSDVVFERGGIL